MVRLTEALKKGLNARGSKRKGGSEHRFGRITAFITFGLIIFLISVIFSALYIHRDGGPSTYEKIPASHSFRNQESLSSGGGKRYPGKNESIRERLNVYNRHKSRNNSLQRAHESPHNMGLFREKSGGQRIARRLWEVVDPDGAIIYPTEIKSRSKIVDGTAPRHTLPMGSVLVAEEISASRMISFMQFIPIPSRYHINPDGAELLYITHPVQGVLSKSISKKSYGNSRDGLVYEPVVRPLRVEPDHRCAAKSFLTFTDFQGGWCNTSSAVKLVYVVC
jgi:hypothetical protein